MAYRFHPSTALDADIRRIAREQIDKAIDELTDGSTDRHEAVHSARKRFKKLRGLVRVVRRGRAEFASGENARYRDAGRLLSAARDRTALIEAIDGLEKRFSGEVETRSFAVVRTALELKRQEVVEAEGDLGPAVASVLASLKDGRSRLDGFLMPKGRTARRRIALKGLEANYRRARRDLVAAGKSEEAEAFHDLRKRVKYLGMHLKLLESLWPSVFVPLREDADRAAEELGRDHDYSVLRAEMAADPASFGSRADLDIVLALLDRHQSELRAAASETCARLLADAPAAFAARIDRLWQLARRRAEPAALPEPPEAKTRRIAA